MKLNKPLYKTTEDNIFILAPTPLYKRVYENDIITNRVYDLGMRVLDRYQKLMGQELPKQ